MKLSKNLRFVVVGLLLISVLGCDSTDMTSAKVYLQQKNYEKAEEMLLLAFEKEPANPDPAYFLATEIYARNKDWDKVAEYLNKSEAIGPKNVEKIKMAREKYWVDNFNLGAKGYNALIKGGVEDEEALYNSVIQSFKNAMLLDPSKPEANSTIAQVYLFKGEFELAKAAMVKAVDMNPEDITSRINLGNVLFRDKEYEEALLHLTKALEIDPSNLNAIKQVAFVYDAMGEKEKAAEAYLDAIKVDPENTDLHYNLGVLYFQQENFEAASKEFIKVAELNPMEVDGLFNAGLAFGRMKNYEEAEKYLEMAYELTPESLDVVHELKMTYYHNYGTKHEKFKAMDKLEKSLK
ncbi:MAG: tetratricopeptide repeat protein [Candidatus Marinimicrobia bacterium]|nr:tetratricopeptide repeat protein [Candidatus Neomarinimicrobiota bacterium]MCF7850639.1 tetratricopeptide repeat protein [Candidatus Neomarinimicrobiota bacterium]MCF7903627.1 tetratricopeptide repeat protein [Candidatus Neomarinimicrobiota bacterium]